MMRVRLISVITVFLALVLATTSIQVSARPIDEVEHRYENGIVFVPLRLTAYAHGATVEWDGPNQTVHVTKATGETLPVIFAAVGGFNYYGRIWIPYEVAANIFASTYEVFEELVPTEHSEEVIEEVIEEAIEEMIEEIVEEHLARPDIHGLITRIEYGDNTAYIFGAVHAGLPEWFPLNPIVEDAMDRADVFAFETNIAEEPTPEFMEQMNNLMILPDGMTLEDVLPSDVFEQFIANLDTFPTVTYEDIAMLTPIAANNHILGTEILQFMNINHDIAVDRWYILQHALLNERTVIGLNDSFVEASKFLDIPLDIQINLLENFLDWDSTIEFFTRFDLAYAYETKNLELIAESMALEIDLDTAFGMYLFERAVVDRGNIFANEIARLLRETEESTVFFVAIGIGHIMGGDFGQVFYLLEAKGFDVVPLWE